MHKVIPQKIDECSVIYTFVPSHLDILNIVLRNAARDSDGVIKQKSTILINFFCSCSTHCEKPISKQEHFAVSKTHHKKYLWL